MGWGHGQREVDVENIDNNMVRVDVWRVCLTAHQGNVETTLCRKNNVVILMFILTASTC